MEANHQIMDPRIRQMNLGRQKGHAHYSSHDFLQSHNVQNSELNLQEFQDLNAPVFGQLGKSQFKNQANFDFSSEAGAFRKNVSISEKRQMIERLKMKYDALNSKLQKY